MLGRPSPVAVEREELVITCASGGRTTSHPSCGFTATYHLYNPSARGEELLGAFYEIFAGGGGAAGEGLRVTRGATNIRLEDADVPTEATDEQLARMDAIVMQDASILADVRAGRTLARTPFTVVVGAGARARLVFRGDLLPTSYLHDSPREGYAIPAILQRHLFLGTSSREEWLDAEDEYTYLVTPIGSGWAGDPEIVVTINHDAGNGFVPASLGRWETSRSGGMVSETARTRASARQNLKFRLVDKGFPLKNGGPLFGMGPRIGREELRARAGYEISGPHWLVYGLAAETNFREYVTAVATVDLATPALIFVIPSLAVGLGVPVQFRKDEPTRVGGRFTFTWSWPLISFLFPIDYYPTPNSSGSHVEGAFVTQLSF